MQRRLILASSSAYRRELLGRLRISFETMSPDIDEQPLPGEAPPLRAVRLARAKALAIAGRIDDGLVLGSDQVASLDEEMLDKPGSHEVAFGQLRRASGRRVSFFTAIALLEVPGPALSVRMVPCHVQFRSLSDALIERYLAREQPYDCAGSAKVEGLGISLIERVDCTDPTALIGLPLITLSEMLTVHGVAVPPQ